jgi:glutaredoxin
MAHRDGPDSAEIVFPKGYESEAALMVTANHPYEKSRLVPVVPKTGQHQTGVECRPRGN